MTTLIVFFDIQYYFSYIIVDLLHRSLTLTERTVIWNEAIEYIKMSPLFGYGIESGLTVAEKIGASHTHNYYLYLFFTGGIVNFLIVFSMMISVSRKMMIYSQTRVEKMFLGVLSATILLGLAESLTQTPLFYPTLIMAYYIPELHVLQQEKDTSVDFASFDRSCLYEN